MNLSDEVIRRVSRETSDGMVHAANISRSGIPVESNTSATPVAVSVTDGEVDIGTVTATPSTTTAWAASGTVRDGAAGVENVSMLISVYETTELTDVNGDYDIKGLPNYTYTITPELDGYTFDPENLEVTIASANNTGNDFTANSVDLSGTILDLLGMPLVGATVTITGGQSDTTGLDGTWQIEVVTDGEKTITPTKDGYEFDPATQVVTVDRASQSGLDFTAKNKIPTEGLVGYWPLMNGSGADYSGLDHHMDIVGSLEANMTDPSGNANAVHNFSGSDYVWTADHADFDFGAGAFSISLWAATYLDAAVTAGPGSLLIKNAATGVSPAGQYLWDFAVDARVGQGWWRFYNGNVVQEKQPVGINAMIKGTAPGVGTSVWQHFVMTRAADGTTLLYFNTTKIACSSMTTSFSNDKPLSIGKAHGATDLYPWKGGICHVRIYKGYVLTDDDVTAIYTVKA